MVFFTQKILQAISQATAKRLFTVVAIFGLAGGLIGCESIPNPFKKDDTYKPEITPDIPAEQLYTDANNRINSGDYEGASKKLDQLDRQYPYSSWARKAQVLNVFSQFRGRAFDDAIASAKRFLQLNPASPDAPYVQYLMAESYYAQVLDVSRDQERSERALAAYQELVARYPSSEYVTDSRQKITVLRDQLAGKEMDIGRFYLKKRNYTGAINRFRDVVSKYQTTRHVEEALMRLTEAYFALGIVNEAQTAAAILGHNFPDSPWYKDAYTLLQTNGLEPREDSGSWISKVFREAGIPLNRIKIGQ
jgi:outer membrane protein assembly factor BamD